MDTIDYIASLWRQAGLPPQALQDLELTGTAAALPSSFAVSKAAQASIALAALAAAHCRHLRTGRRQQVSVDQRHAAIECRSDHYFAIDGKPVRFNDPLTGLYPCGEGGWVRIHANFAHHREGALALLRSAPSREAIAAALRGEDAVDFEAKAAALGLPIVALRNFEQWDHHPQALALESLPTLTITRIGDAPPMVARFAGDGEAGSHPATASATTALGPVRVLELTRILAGPVCGRTLAAYGAEVLLVNSPNLPNIDAIADTSRGKLSAHLDLRHEADCAIMGQLLQTADVFIQGYRPTAIAALGFGPQALARDHPGIVYASLSAWGPAGPWRSRRGFDSLVQTASGFNVAEAAAAGSELPKPLPTQILDHASGYLMAFGIAAALARRTTEGGSWHVQVSLAQTARWLRSMGRTPGDLGIRDPGRDDVADLLQASPSGFGSLTAVRHSAVFSQTPARWLRPSVPPGSNPPAWAPV